MILNVDCHCSTLYTTYVLNEIHIRIWNFVFHAFSLGNVETVSFRSMFCAVSHSVDKVDSPSLLQH
jgi:hypothetical protein